MWPQIRRLPLRALPRTGQRSPGSGAGPGVPPPRPAVAAPAPGSKGPPRFHMELEPNSLVGFRPCLKSLAKGLPLRDAERRFPPGDLGQAPSERLQKSLRFPASNERPIRLEAGGLESQGDRFGRRIIGPATGADPKRGWLFLTSLCTQLTNAINSLIYDRDFVQSCEEAVARKLRKCWVL